MNKFNIKEIKNKANNKFIIYFIVITFVIMIANIIIRLIFFPNININPSQYQFINKDGSSSVFLDVEYSGSEINVPPKLSIAQTEKTTFRFSIVTNSIIDNLSLIPHPEIENLWTNNLWYFNFQEDTNEYILLNNSEDIDTQETLPLGFDQDKLITFANSQKNVFFPDLEIIAQTNNIKYWPSAHEYTETTTIDKATVAIIPFAYTIDSFPIFYEKEVNSPFEFIIESDLTFRKMTYFPQNLSYKKIGEKNSISIEEAINNIKDKNISSIIAYYQEEGSPLEIEEVKTADFRYVSIEYRIDNSQGLIYPFYKFEGQATTSNDNLWIEVITPAIELNQ